MTNTLDYQGMTYGAEHELADWDTRKGLPPRFGVDKRDFSMVNSDGVAVDPKQISWHFGGEINTPPTDMPEGQVEALKTFLAMHPDAKVNYRSNLHVHVRLPGLRDDLPALKRVQRIVHSAEFFQVLNKIEPIPKPVQPSHWAGAALRDGAFEAQAEYDGAMRRYRRRLRSHHTRLTKNRVERQLEARTVREFLEREVPSDAEGRPLWHLQPRCCVNLRQLRETDTIEFRHFPGTLDGGELLTCVEWCGDFVRCASANGSQASDIVELYERRYAGRGFPAFPPYVHWMEERYRATCHDGTVPRKQIEEEIARIVSARGKEQE